MLERGARRHSSSIYSTKTEQIQTGKIPAIPDSLPPNEEEAKVVPAIDKAYEKLYRLYVFAVPFLCK